MQKYRTIDMVGHTVSPGQSLCLSRPTSVPVLFSGTVSLLMASPVQGLATYPVPSVQLLSLNQCDTIFYSSGFNG
jgi:hypothetical protein